MTTPNLFFRSRSLWLGVVALALNTAFMLRAVEVTGAEASRSNAAVFSICKAPGACGVACVPPAGCIPNVGGACVPTAAGINGMSIPAAIVGTCGFSWNPFATCPPLAPCGVNVTANCPPFAAGGCPPGACTPGAAVPPGC